MRQISGVCKAKLLEDSSMLENTRLEGYLGSVRFWRRTSRGFRSYSKLIHEFRPLLSHLVAQEGRLARRKIFSTR